MDRFDQIKLVIWDLDDTLWNGTISEGEVSLPQLHSRAVRRFADIGIVNSICSMNDFTPAMERLEKEGLAEYFVFPSIDWNPKGPRIKELIGDMQLRPCNVLFLDDKPSNLAQAQYHCPDLMVGGPELIPELLADAEAVTRLDPDHARLKQYRVLEEKHSQRKISSSNEEFLLQSQIQVQILPFTQEHLPRVEDLVLRSNQLNFTKIRSSREQLQALLQDGDVEAGCVAVQDRYGDYGIAGFYAKKGDRLVHFVFSCRILGMGVEQWVYHRLGRPQFTAVGEINSDLSQEAAPAWINQSGQVAGGNHAIQIENLQASSVLVKGPCDLFQVFPYIADTHLFDTEFTYTLPSGLVIESTGHTTHVVEALRLSKEQVERITNEVPFTDKGMYCDNIFRKGYKAVFISILADCNLGVYRRKDTGERFAFLEYIHPITDPTSWQGLMDGSYPTSGYRFTREVLERFAEQYEFVGRNSPEQILENLEIIRENLPSDCILAVMLGGELAYEKNTIEAYVDRHLVHKAVNHRIREWAKGQPNVRLMDVNEHLVDQSSFYDHFNHYTKPVYYALAQQMAQIVKEATGKTVGNTSKLKMVLVRLKEMLAPAYYKLRKLMRKS